MVKWLSINHNESTENGVVSLDQSLKYQSFASNDCHTKCRFYIDSSLLTIVRYCREHSSFQLFADLIKEIIFLWVLAQFSNILNLIRQCTVLNLPFILTLILLFVSKQKKYILLAISINFFQINLVFYKKLDSSFKNDNTYPN